MEQIYLKEYYALVDKDKADGKDFNKLREQSMMVQQYHFEYQRQLVKEKEQAQSNPVQEAKPEIAQVQTQQETTQKVDTRPDLTANQKARMVRRTQEKS